MNRDRVSLAAGLVCLLVGAVFGLDQLGVVSLGPNLAAAAVCAAAGIVLVVSGLEPDRAEGEEGEGE